MQTSAEPTAEETSLQYSDLLAKLVRTLCDQLALYAVQGTIFI